MFIVKQKNKDHPRGIQVSRVYNSRAAADDLVVLLKTKAPENTEYWVTDYCPREKHVF